MPDMPPEQILKNLLQCQNAYGIFSADCERHTMNNTQKIETKPPYVAYRTFHNFVTDLRASAVPDRIDRTVLVGLSGANQSFLLSALRFLGFIDEQGVPSDDFVKLVKEPANEKALLGKTIKIRYVFLFEDRKSVV